MIVVLKRGTGPEAVQAMAARVEELGMKAHVIVGTERTVVAAVGRENEADRRSLRSSPLTRLRASKPNRSRLSSAPAA
jgi:3-deoxy-7-phosphoheptulonate synthase